MNQNFGVATQAISWRRQQLSLALQADKCGQLEFADLYFHREKDPGNWDHCKGILRVFIKAPTAKECESGRKHIYGVVERARDFSRATPMSRVNSSSVPEVVSFVESTMANTVIHAETSVRPSTRARNCSIFA